jgi:hypothetical protein
MYSYDRWKLDQKNEALAREQERREKLKEDRVSVVYWGLGRGAFLCRMTEEKSEFDGHWPNVYVLELICFKDVRENEQLLRYYVSVLLKKTIIDHL